MTYRRSFLVILLIAVSLVGCKSGPKTELKKVSFTLPAGWTKSENAEQGISIGSPPGWSSLQDLLAQAEAKPAPGSAPPITGDNSQMAQQLDQLSQQLGKMGADEIRAAIKEKESSGIYIYCPDSNIKPIPGEKTTHFSVMKKSVGGNAQMQDALNEMADKDSPETVTLPIGAASKTHSKVTLKDGGEVTTISYGLVNGGDVYVVTFVTEVSGMNLDDIASQVIKTLRIDK